MSNLEATYWREQYETELRKRQAAELQLALLQATPAQPEAAPGIASQQTLDLALPEETLTRRQIVDMTGLSYSTVIHVLTHAGIKPVNENKLNSKNPAEYNANEIWELLNKCGVTREDTHLYRANEIAQKTGQPPYIVYSHAQHGKLKTVALGRKVHVSGIRFINEYTERLKA